MKKTTKANEGFINETALEFNDISSEKHREYGFPNGTVLKIEDPLYLNVSPSGGHRLYSDDGYCWYIQPREGWYVKWQVRKGSPSFVK